eukprot:GHRR01011682.1.p1 GENE.GHRR01011682.1~~GHRR01011682.1.p1  ORF type:complete len:514 (+),score=178.06 GHRR01011682.1:92-1633(+)
MEPGSPKVSPGKSNTTSRTITDTIIGEHTHTIVGYSLIKGIGDGEPIASERFTVGGHEWVLLFYPDGKRSSSSDAQLGPGDAAAMHHAVAAVPPPGIVVGQPGQPAAHPHVPNGPAAAAGGGAAAVAAPGAAAADGDGMAAAPPPPAAAGGAAAGAVIQGMVPHHHGHPQGMPAAAAMQLARMAPPQGRRDTTNEYAALFVALIGEGPNPQGVVNTNEGKVVRAFHRFSLVDQTGQGRDLTKGRTREAGAVKISCARQDPNARNCHGYRKFVKRNILEDPARGFLVNDTIVIKYTIELVVSTGGALSRTVNPTKTELIKVPPPGIGKDLAELFHSGQNSDYVIVVEHEGQAEEIRVHRMLLESRSPFFRGMLESNMAEAQQGRFMVRDMLAPVVKAVLYFMYTDQLPEELEGANLEVAMAQHLLAAADLYQLTRLRRICERRLCESVDVETVATTLALAEQNHAEVSCSQLLVCSAQVGASLCRPTLIATDCTVCHGIGCPLHLIFAYRGVLH